LSKSIQSVDLHQYLLFLIEQSSWPPMTRALGLKEGDKLDETSLGGQVGNILDDLALKVIETEPFICNSPFKPDDIEKKAYERRMLKTAFNALYERSVTFGIGLAGKDGYYHEAAKKFRAVHGK
jgi:hypothetical protein